MKCDLPKERFEVLEEQKAPERPLCSQKPKTGLLLRNVTIEDQRLLSPFDIHCGDYVRMFNGYRQRTGPFRISWSRELVQQKILHVDDPSRRAFLQ